MRFLSLLLLSLAAAGPAAAQLLPSQTYDPAREAELANQQMLARQQDTALRNQMMTMEAQARADQGVRQLEAQGARPTLSPLSLPPMPPAGPR